MGEFTGIMASGIAALSDLSYAAWIRQGRLNSAPFLRHIAIRHALRIVPQAHRPP